MRYQGLNKPDYKQTVNFTDAGTPDIIAVIHQNFAAGTEQTKNFASRFKGDTVKGTAFKIWNFLRNKIQYIKDSDEAQNIKLPTRFVADGTGDCKSYSLFTASILKNLNLPVSFRYASYKSSNIPTHVYVTTRDEHGNEIIIDGVYNKFNKEVPFTYKKDFLMNVSTLSGINADIPSPVTVARRGVWRMKTIALLTKALAKHPKGGLKWLLINERLLKLQRLPYIPIKLTPAQITEGNAILAAQAGKKKGIFYWLLKRKLAEATSGAVDSKFSMIRGINDINGIGRRGKERYKGKLIHLANLTALAPARSALISLIAINFRGLAGKFAGALKYNNRKLKQRWYIMGGNPKKLVSYINKGKRKKPFMGGKKTSEALKKENLSGLYGISDLVNNQIYDTPVNLAGIGVAPAVAAPAWLALAGSLLAVLAKLFQKKGDGTEAPGTSTSEILSQAGQTADSASRAADSILNPPNVQTAGVTTEDSPKNDTLPTSTESFNEKTGFKINPVLIGAAALAAVFLFSKSKK